jgi:hypothetical protein
VFKRRHGVPVADVGNKSVAIAYDAKAALTGAAARHYRCRDGTIYETKRTPQRLPNAAFDRAGMQEQICCSGDGTVPYLSMRHSASWDTGPAGDIRSQVVELPLGQVAEHRNILASRALHDILGGYLCETLAVYIIAARGLAAKDIGGSSDPYVLATLYWNNSGNSTGDALPPVQQRTATKKHTLDPEFDEVLIFGGRRGENLCGASYIELEVRDDDKVGSDHIGIVQVHASSTSLAVA